MPRVTAASSLLRLVFFALAAVGAVEAAACGGDDAAADGGQQADATAESSDVCASFTGADMPCPTASPTRCFPMCATGGCYCRGTPQGLRWSCVTDLSCTPDCGPLDDRCAPAPGDDGAPPGDAVEAEASDAAEGGDAADAGMPDAGATDAASD
jgi:hypothetical protein